MGDRVRYEHKTVRALPGTRRLVIAKWEKRGWQLTDPAPDSARTEVTFRRATTRTSVRQAIAIGAIALLCAGAITIGVLTEDHAKDNPRRAATESSEPATIEDFLAAAERGDLQEYAQDHYADPIEFDARVTGVAPPALKTAAFINLRSIVDGKSEGPQLRLMWGSFSRDAFPTDMERGDNVRVRANIDTYFSDEDVWLTRDDDDSFIRPR